MRDDSEVMLLAMQVLRICQCCGNDLVSNERRYCGHCLGQVQHIAAGFDCPAAPLDENDN